MKYFLDFEFIEGFHKPLFGKRRHFIDLISIGIVSEDNRGLYFLSSEYNYNDADEWVKENVILKAYQHAVNGDNRNRYSSNTFHKSYGIPVKDICKEVLRFIGDDKDIFFYGYYSDYDWVLFCSMFGRMIDLPQGFPMYCRDLKQMFDDKISPLEIKAIGYEKAVERLKNKNGYPKQSNEHLAINDAAWNKELYNWLQTF